MDVKSYVAGLLTGLCIIVATGVVSCCQSCNESCEAAPACCCPCNCEARLKALEAKPVKPIGEASPN